MIHKDRLHSGAANDKYRDHWEDIFGFKKAAVYKPKTDEDGNEILIKSEITDTD